MQILIEISEESYNKLIQKSMLMSASAIDEAVDAVKNGIVLPNGHGRLIDADAVLEEPIGDTYLDIDIAETIIEADKEVK